MIRKLYPEGKRKAFNITYDDGAQQDERFVALLNQYGMKGTFHLNSELMKNGFTWTHESGLEIRRLSAQKARLLYQGHEVASHSLTHPCFEGMTRQQLLWEIGMDRYFLQEIFGTEIGGFAVPFDYYDEAAADCVRECGFSYARTSQESHGYCPGYDWYWQKAGIYHISGDLKQYVEGFLHTQEELAFGQIVGHSYDLDTLQMWELMESLISRVAADKDTLPVTHLEAVRYWQAMQKAVIEEAYIFNGSDTVLWFEINGKVCSVSPGERLEIK
ncbi:MAG: polysaccharide deacetylase family protein [Lachnospiraceae bacterium]|nr:polysaccharide deacetylase family protein [Lachnospiraceae bacterium]